MADPLEFSFGGRHLDLSSRLADLGTNARFRGTQVALQGDSGIALRDPIFAARVSPDISFEFLRAFLPGTSIWVRDARFRPVVPGTNREHEYGLATQSFGPWFREQLIALSVALIIGTILLIVLYAVFRRAPRTWWIWGTGVAVLFLFAVTFIAPIYIEPLFNTYKPLSNPEIRDPILAMARANEIPVKQVFEVDASRQTTRVSANVAGFLGTTRIALNDNLLRQCTPPEIREVMAHEMGRYVLNHGAKLLTYFGIFVFIGFALTCTLFDAAVRQWGAKWGVRGIADPAGLPLLVLILSTFIFVLTPFLNTVVRVTEREADAFGINTAREPDGMAKVALKLGAYRKLNPTPLEEFIFFDHPSGRARIRMAMDWKAANLPAGESVPAEGAPAVR